MTVATPAGLDNVSKNDGVNVDCTPFIVASEGGVMIAGGRVGEASRSLM